MIYKESFCLSSFSSYSCCCVVSVTHWYHLQNPKTKAPALFVMMLLSWDLLLRLVCVHLQLIVVWFVLPGVVLPPSLQFLLFI